MRSLAVAATMVLATILAGCVGNDAGQLEAADDVGPSIDRQQPAARELPDSISALRHVAATDGDHTGAGIWLYGPYAYVSAQSSGLFIYDVSDPENPVLAGNISSIGEAGDEISFGARDVDILDQGDRVVAVLAFNNGGMHFVDVTDPTQPEYLTSITDFRVHNVAVPPGQSDFVYNSMSGAQGTVHIIDASDPESPQVVGKFGTHGCHDLMFLDLPDKKRAYCAGIVATEIWDIEDLLNPVLISSISRESYPWTDSFDQGLHHLALPNQDGTVLILGDEWRGGGSPGACLFYWEAPDGTQLSAPLGALTFFDISDERNPVFKSWITPPTADPDVDAAVEAANPNSALPSCTSHFGTMIEDRDQLVMAWYTAGVLLIDFSELENPVILDQWVEPGVDVWDARYYQGYVFTGDIRRGLDVLTFA